MHLIINHTGHKMLPGGVNHPIRLLRGQISPHLLDDARILSDYFAA